MNAQLRRLLLPILRTVRSGKAPSFRNRSAAEQALYLLGKPASQRRKKAAAARKSAKGLIHRDATASIREAVFRRAGGYCEVPGCGAHGHALDHWLGGVGRRRQRQSVETCWVLCFHCHALRTTNVPTVQHWNKAFRDHCEQHGYSIIPHIVHEQMTSAASAAQPPAKALSGDES